MSKSLRKKTALDAAKLSVVLACLGGYNNIRKTIAALQQQTVPDQLEVVIVAARDSGVMAQHLDLDDFHSVQVVAVDRIESVAKANAVGIRAATAPVVALAEDHAFPHPGWAEALIEAHRADWAAVGPAVQNANPKTAISWADFLIGYGPWSDPVSAGPADFLPGHNSSYKRAILLEYDSDLEAMLEAETLLHWDLRSKDHQLYLEPKAKISHTNFSRLTSWVWAQYHCGRVFAGTRVTTMSWLQRLIYMGGSPLIPCVRFWRLLGQIHRAKTPQFSVVRVLPVLFFGLSLDGLGQLVGHAFGIGASKDKLAPLEFHRFEHITAQDREALLS